MKWSGGYSEVLTDSSSSALWSLVLLW